MTRFFHPCLEGLEDRLAPAVANYWVGQPIPPIATAAWEVDTNWSLGHQPTASEDAIFDAGPGHSLHPCTLSQGRVAAPASVQISGDWTGTLNVSGAISTPAFTLNARAAAGLEVLIAQGGQVEVTGTMTFGGGNVSGSGTLLVDNRGALNVTGTSNVDLPTLGCPLQLGSADGTSPAAMNFGPNAAVQPLVVTGNATITVFTNSSITFNGRPLPGQTSVNAISNGDGGAETIYVHGGLAISSGAYEQFVGMGLDIATGGQVIAGNSGGNGTLHFTGMNAANHGLDLWSGWLTVNASMAIDNGAVLTGGTVQEGSNQSTLTLGLAAASPVSQMSGATVNLPGTLIAHGGFQMTGGTFNTTGSTASTVTVDSGTSFTLGGGTLNVARTNGDNTVSGQLTVNGAFQGIGGALVINVSTAQFRDTQGLLQVNGNLTANASMTLFCSDQANPAARLVRDWTIVRFTGLPSGSLTYNLPPNWTLDWLSDRIVVHER